MAKKPEVKLDFGIGGLFGGLFKGIEKLIELAEKAEKAGGEIKKEGEIRGGTKEKPIRGIYGFSIRTGLDKEKNRVQTFGNIKPTKKGPKIVKIQEPLTDIFDEGNSILVVVEIPGVQENEIKINLQENTLFLETAGQRKYAKKITLPTKVDFESKETTFKNGILELRLKKK